MKLRLFDQEQKNIGFIKVRIYKRVGDKHYAASLMVNVSPDEFSPIKSKVNKSQYALQNNSNILWYLYSETEEEKDDQDSPMMVPENDPVVKMMIRVFESKNYANVEGCINNLLFKDYLQELLKIILEKSDFKLSEV